ncbi:MAG: matrixin family metalloprotease [Myxococcales bacterium]|nr:matrixin family metalloprotease [Myxococcales bacterium]
MVHRTTVLQGLLLGLVACEGESCELARAGFEAPLDAVEEGDVWVSRFDNPMLSGRANVTAAADRTPGSTFVERRLFGPDLAFLTEDRGEGLDRGRVSQAYVWSEETTETIAVGAPFFAAPSVRLDADHRPTEFALWRLGSRRAGPAGPMGPVGFTEEQVDTQRVRLDDQVILLPVHATVFAPLSGDPVVEPEALAQLLDPGRSTTLELTRANFDTESAAQLDAGRFHDDGATRSGTTPPDRVWTVCDVQFRLEEVEVVPQDQGLERQLIESTDPCGPFFSGPLTDHLQTPEALGAIPLVVGGTITVDFLATFLGVTCPPQASHEFVAMDERYLQTEGVLAHELGHFVGLDHSTDRSALMHPPDPDSRSVLGTYVSDDECDVVRCDAARFLQRLGRAEPGLVDEACAVFEPVCGNGERERGESCDDGNLVAGDGCRADCTEERCGDQILDPGEDCDTTDPDLRQDCTTECLACDGCNVCGDGVVGHGEACDDGNLIDGDGCSSVCVTDGLI